MPDHGELRGILLAKECRIRLDDVKEFGDYGGHASKMSGPRMPVESLAQSFYRDPGRLALLIHLLGSWSEENIDPLFFERCAIALERTRIFGKIFRGSKLSGIHKDRSRDNFASRLCDAHQRQMPGMQGAHRRHTPESK